MQERGGGQVSKAGSGRLRGEGKHFGRLVLEGMIKDKE